MKVFFIKKFEEVASDRFAGAGEFLIILPKPALGCGVLVKKMCFARFIVHSSTASKLETPAFTAIFR